MSGRRRESDKYNGDVPGMRLYRSRRKIRGRGDAVEWKASVAFVYREVMDCRKKKKKNFGNEEGDVEEEAFRF